MRRSAFVWHRSSHLENQLHIPTHPWPSRLSEVPRPPPRQDPRAFPREAPFAVCAVSHNRVGTLKGEWGAPSRKRCPPANCCPPGVTGTGAKIATYRHSLLIPWSSQCSHPWPWALLSFNPLRAPQSLLFVVPWKEALHESTLWTRSSSNW